MRARKRVLLDACVPRPFKRELRPHTVAHVSELGWQDFDDRPLLERAEGNFDALVTVDQNLPYQQNLTRLTLTLIILKAHKNTLSHLQPLVPELLTTLDAIQPGGLYHIQA